MNRFLVAALGAQALADYAFQDVALGDVQEPLYVPCKTSRMSAYASLPSQLIDIHPTARSPVFPSLPSLNSTTGEQWEFDAISSAADSGILVAFYRDPEFAFLGAGNLRINADVTFPDGQRQSLMDYAEESIVEECDGLLTGTWMRPGHMWSFTYDSALQVAHVAIDTPQARGSIHLKAVSRARHADGSLWTGAASPNKSAHDNIPSMFWFEPIPMATASVNLTLADRHLQWSGIGGSERIWQGRTWFEILRGYAFLRAQLGDYAISYWTATSKENGRSYGNLLLSERGHTVFSSARRVADPAEVQDGEDAFLYVPTFGGSVRSGLKNNLATGYDLILISASAKAQWKFHFEHKQVMFEFNLGNDAGGTAFIGHASGGKAGQQPTAGIFLNEAVDFTNLWIPDIVVHALWWFHWLKFRAAGLSRSMLDMVLAYSM